MTTFFSTYGGGGGGWDAYADLVKGATKETDYEKPPKPGEYAELIGKLSPDKQAQFRLAVVTFKELSKILPNTRESFDETKEKIKARTEVELETAAKTMLVALRKGNVGSELQESIKKQLYKAYLKANEFNQALDLYPALRSIIGGRMNGILALETKIRERILKVHSLQDYFETIKESRKNLLQILEAYTPGDEKTFMTVPNRSNLLFYFGSILPMYYLLSSCADLTGGLCGNCNSSTETRVRLLVGNSIQGVKPGILTRVCEFASSFA